MSAFGDFAMQAIEPGRLTARQIEAARMAITRHVKRAGKLWIRIFPIALSPRAPEVRMWRKGGVEEWAARHFPGRVMYEISGSTKDAREAFRLAGHKLRRASSFSPAECSDHVEGQRPERRSLEDLKELEKSPVQTFQTAEELHNRLDDTSNISKRGKDLARVLTVLSHAARHRAFCPTATTKGRLTDGKQRLPTPSPSRRIDARSGAQVTRLPSQDGRPRHPRQDEQDRRRRGRERSP